MKSKEQVAKEYADEMFSFGCNYASKNSFLAGVAFAEQWIDVNEELPEINKGSNRSNCVLLKVKGKGDRFTGYYHRWTDDEDKEFHQFYIYDTWNPQDKVTHWRPINR